mgnify:CR=1 FL=1
MKIALLSDIHLSMGSMAFPSTEADVTVLAGDVGRPVQAISWASAAEMPCLFVAGNHEFYGSDLVSTCSELRRLSRGTSVQVLERSEWHYQGVRFLGCTLWSDYRLFRSEEARHEGTMLAEKVNRDFSRIRIAPDHADLLTIPVTQLLFEQSVAWLEQCFSQRYEGSTVVITHFAPSPLSIAERFNESPINAAFVSDLRAQIRRWKPKLWIHGHTHDRMDYQLGETRIVCNPRGYVDKLCRPENRDFDPEFTVEVL